MTLTKALRSSASAPIRSNDHLKGSQLYFEVFECLEAIYFDLRDHRRLNPPFLLLCVTTAARIVFDIHERCCYASISHNRYLAHYTRHAHVKLILHARASLEPHQPPFPRRYRRESRD